MAVNQHIVVQKKPWTPDLGDFYPPGAQYVKCPFDWTMADEYAPIALSAMSEETWTVLARIGVCNAGPVLEDFRYDCPWTDNTYWHFVPWVLLAKDPSVFKQPSGSWGELAFDCDWIRSMWMKGFKDLKDPQVLEPDRVARSMLGHGYTNWTLPSDGSVRYIVACLGLNDDSLIAGWLNLWFNK
jgi:hypothetical protein